MASTLDSSVVTSPAAAWTSSDELQPLVPRKTSVKVLLNRYLTTRKCFSSPAIVTILAISFLVQILYHFFSDPSHLLPSYFSNYEQYSHLSGHHPILARNVVKQSCTVALLMVYPFAGYLADTRLGHYRTILVSLRILVPSLALTLVGGGVLVIVFVIMKESNLAHTILIVAGAVSFSAGLLPLLLAIVGIAANVVQLGLDQLFDSPWDDQLVFITWYMWARFAARLVVVSLNTVYCISDSKQMYYITAVTVFFVIMLALGILLFFASWKKIWFVTNYYRSRLNPYHIVHQVTRYAWRNNVPLHRIAFSWCRNHHTPSGLDVGMKRFGGPFTAEQVEDVKAFYGIVKVLVVSGLFFFFANITYETTEFLGIHINIQSNTSRETGKASGEITPTSACPQTARYAIISDLLPRTLIVVYIPCYIILLRPLITHHLPGMLKTIGIVMTLTLLPVISALLLDTAIDTATHGENRNVRCMFNNLRPTQSTGSGVSIARTIDKYFYVYNTAVLAFTDYLVVVMYVSLFKFICSQSPHSTKGFLVGLSFAVTGFYELANPLLALLLGFAWSKISFPSCGMIYYFINIVLGLAAVLLYATTARRHKYRRRGSEPYNSTGGDVDDHCAKEQNRLSNYITHS